MILLMLRSRGQSLSSFWMMELLILWVGAWPYEWSPLCMSLWIASLKLSPFYSALNMIKIKALLFYWNSLYSCNNNIYFSFPSKTTLMVFSQHISGWIERIIQVFLNITTIMFLSMGCEIIFLISQLFTYLYVLFFLPWKSKQICN